jgi:hypothetical protein
MGQWVRNEKGVHLTIEIPDDFDVIHCASDQQFDLCVMLDVIKRA